MNEQQPEKQIRDIGLVLDVHSIFHTIQGEGPFTGSPAVFVRLAGCNLRCPGCDTDYTEGRQLLSVADILFNVQAYRPNGLVVVTGGEPFRQNLEPLFNTLLDAGYVVQVETNGTLAPTPYRYNLNPWERKGVYIVCSPKTPKVNRHIKAAACAFKYVVSANSIASDGLPLSVLGLDNGAPVARPDPWFGGMVYIQPADEGMTANTQANIDAAVQICREHGYSLQLQIHKLIGAE